MRSFTPQEVLTHLDTPGAVLPVLGEDLEQKVVAVTGERFDHISELRQAEEPTS